MRGLLVSIPDGRQPTLNRLHLVAGHQPTAGREAQVVVSDAFAQAHGLAPGDSVEAIINGRRTRLTLSGIALSPEFLYQAGPTDLLPDYRRYALLWMNRRALADAYGMQGAFNQLSLTLQAGADADTLIDALDQALARYGGTGARTSLLGLEAVPRLRPFLDVKGASQALPPEGLVLTRYLAEWLQIGVGDRLEVAIMEGHRRRLSLPVAALVDEPVGVGAYLRREHLNRLMREGPTIGGAWLLVDDDRRDALLDELHDLPVVAGIGLMDEAKRGVRKYLDETLQVFALVFVTLAGSIAFGVIYNNARISFAERARELATLLVLGYIRSEVSRILLGEIALLGGLAILPGWAIGIGFCTLLSEAFSNDLFRIPLAFTPRIFGLSAAGVVSASALVGLLMLRRLWTLDKIGVLKAPE